MFNIIINSQIEPGKQQQPEIDTHGLFLYACDLPEAEVAVEIVDVMGVTLEQKPRMALLFKDIGKPLVLNIGNQQTIVALYGADWESWIGKHLVLYTTTTEFAGKTVPCIRIKAPADYVCPFKPRTFARAEAVNT
jgi:hypothetical protein